MLRWRELQGSYAFPVVDEAEGGSFALEGFMVVRFEPLVKGAFMPFYGIFRRQAAQLRPDR